MSTFVRVSKHPQTKKWELATWIDDYFGPHVYGVQFKSDGKTYPTEMVEKVEVKNYFAEDVKVGFLKYLEDILAIVKPFMSEHEAKTFDPNEDLLKFLNFIELSYNERWERDPILGEGATLEDIEE